MTVHRIRALGGYGIEAPDGDHIGTEMSGGRPYEPWVLATLRAIVHNGVFIDVGAHVGNHTVHLAKSGATVVAFEPHPDSFTFLTRNVDRNGLAAKVELCQVGLGARPGTGSVSIPDPGNTGSATVATGAGSVRIVTLDELGLSPDAIKIDAEGSETDVLAGALGTLRRSLPAVICEVHAGTIDPILRPLGYRRLGTSLAASPTFLYVARTEHLRRALPLALVGSLRFGLRRLRHTVARRPKT